MQPIAVPLTDPINLLERPTSYRLPDQRRSSNEGAGELIYYIGWRRWPAGLSPAQVETVQVFAWVEGATAEQRRTQMRRLSSYVQSKRGIPGLDPDMVILAEGAFLFELGAVIVSSSDDVAYLCMENHGMLF